MGYYITYITPGGQTQHQRFESALARTIWLVSWGQHVQVVRQWEG